MHTKTILWKSAIILDYHKLSSSDETTTTIKFEMLLSPFIIENMYQSYKNVKDLSTVRITNEILK